MKSSVKDMNCLAKRKTDASQHHSSLPCIHMMLFTCTISCFSSLDYELHLMTCSDQENATEWYSETSESRSDRFYFLSLGSQLPCCKEAWAKVLNDEKPQWELDGEICMTTSLGHITQNICSNISGHFFEGFFLDEINIASVDFE